jgi:hypothetical protein
MTRPRFIPALARRRPVVNSKACRTRGRRWQREVGNLGTLRSDDNSVVAGSEQSLTPPQNCHPDRSEA